MPYRIKQFVNGGIYHVVMRAIDGKIIFKDTNDVIFAEQTERKGTAHAVETALQDIPSNITDVIILQGDDSFSYPKQTIEDLIKEHRKNKN